MARFEEFWELACDFKQMLRLAFMFVVFLLVLSMMGLLLAERGTASYAISIFNFVAVAVLGLVIGGVNRVCSNREREYY